MKRSSIQKQVSAKRVRILYGGAAALLAVYAVISALVWQGYAGRTALRAERLSKEIVSASELDDTSARLEKSQHLHSSKNTLCAIPAVVAWQTVVAPSYTQKITHCKDILAPHASALAVYDTVTEYYQAEAVFVKALRHAQHEQDGADPQISADVWRATGETIKAQPVPEPFQQTKDELVRAIGAVEQQWTTAAMTGVYATLPSAYDQLANAQLSARAAQDALSTTFNRRVRELPHK